MLTTLQRARVRSLQSKANASKRSWIKKECERLIDDIYREAGEKRPVKHPAQKLTRLR